MATIVASEVGDSKILQYALLGGGAFLIYEFWDEIKALFEVGKGVTETATKLLDEADVPGAVESIGDVASDVFSGDPDWAAKGLRDFENMDGVLKPLSGITKGLESAFDIDTSIPENLKTPWLDKTQPCHPDNIANFGQILEYNDWRPDNCQEAIAGAIVGNYGNLDAIFAAHQNHLARGVRSGQGGPVRMSPETEGVAGVALFSVGIPEGVFKICPIAQYAEESGRNQYFMGIGYFLARSMDDQRQGPHMKALDAQGDETYTELRQRWADVLNSHSLGDKYLVEAVGGSPMTNRERRLVDSLGLTAVAQGGSIVFSLKPIS